ncbi:hypothetical protein QR680_012828 [Steinernema hermaphroditum]|uniref:DH domain-containing protein n=1 Tax=Steinernema hermaphroditum TaxID=289476 RepID=A0AA39I5F3_9BILA|nr:hypothetical protein QR680_012828 [Steinernema hermaphroditum]
MKEDADRAAAEAAMDVDTSIDAGDAQDGAQKSHTSQKKADAKGPNGEPAAEEEEKPFEEANKKDADLHGVPAFDGVDHDMQMNLVDDPEEQQKKKGDLYADPILFSQGQVADADGDEFFLLDEEMINELAKNGLRVSRQFLSFRRITTDRAAANAEEVISFCYPDDFLLNNVDLAKGSNVLLPRNSAVFKWNDVILNRMSDRAKTSVGIDRNMERREDQVEEELTDAEKKTLEDRRRAAKKASHEIEIMATQAGTPAELPPALKACELFQPEDMPTMEMAHVSFTMFSTSDALDCFNGEEYITELAILRYLAYRVQLINLRDGARPVTVVHPSMYYPNYELDDCDLPEFTYLQRDRYTMAVIPIHISRRRDNIEIDHWAVAIADLDWGQAVIYDSSPETTEPCMDYVRSTTAFPFPKRLESRMSSSTTSSSRPRFTADDSDSSSDETAHTPRRSATVSPSARHRMPHHAHRRRSDVNLSGSGLGVDRRHRQRSTHRERQSVERHVYRHSALRKTSSEPSVERSQQLHVEAIRQLLDSFPIVRMMEQSSSAHDVWATPRQSLVPLANGADSSEEELMSTDIEELRDAAESIQSLQRVLKQSELPPTGSKGAEESTMSSSLISRDSTIGAESESEGGSVSMKGITTNLGGHPRGVMQFLPSVNLDTCTWSKRRRSSANDAALFHRKTSMPEGYHLASFHNQVFAIGGPQSEQSSPRTAISARPSTRRSTLRPTDESELDVLHPKGVDSIAGVSRFSKLLKSLKSSRQNSPEAQWSPLLIPDAVAQHQLQQNLLQADMLLWKKRSRASLRRHQDVRNMAARELFETEKTFVEGLEHLVQKYMRPLKQPLECTLIDTQHVDRIFYRIPEILAHHQVLLAALSSRIECWQSDTPIGDVLLAHFTKRSMIETYEAFVDNFKYAKQAIVEARQKPAFEKYYMRCRRDHRNKLDLDSLLILPIQRVPRYELILKQIVKHTPVEHRDYEKLLRVQKEVHDLALSINRQREENEQMEQRLREIEAIVDGLEDLVSTGRTFVRYDLVTINGSSGKKQRCLFMMSDQLIVTSVRRKASSGLATRLNKSQSLDYSVQSPDFLDRNRFKLLIKISMDDIDIGKETLSILQQTEKQLTNAKEDEKIISKMMDLAKLLKNENTTLTNLLEEIHTERKYKLKCLEDQMNSNPDLTTVHLQVTTFDGVETLTVEFPNADKRTIWENSFLESKNALKNFAHADQPQVQLKSVIAHRTRPGLIFSKAASTFGKTAEGAPNVWACSTDKFASQVAIVNVNGEPTVESCTGIGNSAIVAVCPVPAPSFRRRKSILAGKTRRCHSQMELDSCSSDSDVSDSDPSSPSTIQSTIWIGNEDGELYVFNYLDNVRLKAREKMNKLSLPVQDIAYVDESVFISIASTSHSQLLCFQRGRDMNWDLDNVQVVKTEIRSTIRKMVAVCGRLCVGADDNFLYLLNPNTHDIEKKCQLSSSPSEAVSCMSTHGSTIFVSTTNASTVRMIDVFSNNFEPILEFSVSHVINKTLSVREDIIRQHKMGCLRVSSLLCCRNMLWIGTSAGIILHTPIQFSKANWTPTFTVCQVGHAGPCRFLTTVNVSAAYSNVAMDVKKRRMSLNAAALQSMEQLYVISGGTGVDYMNPNMPKTNHETESVGVDDAVNHLLFWQLSPFATTTAVHCEELLEIADVLDFETELPPDVDICRVRDPFKKVHRAIGCFLSPPSVKEAIAPVEYEVLELEEGLKELYQQFRGVGVLIGSLPRVGIGFKRDDGSGCGTVI